MQALYRKYRSKKLSEIVGQDHIVQTLSNAIENGRISHAYLFTGPRGVGKTSIARILAHEINKLPYDESHHLDIIEIDAASNRRIDDIRDLRDKVHIAPASAKYKVYIIDEVHMLTGESFNALLKTLEEPPSHVIFILATTEVHKLPATIVSRTQRYSFRSADPEKLKEHLKYIADKENIKIDDEAIALVAEHGNGSFRDSISLLDQLANLSHSDIKAEIVEQTLGLAPRAVIKSLIEAILKKDHRKVIDNLESLEKQGSTISATVSQLTTAITALAPKYTSLYKLLDRLIEVPKAYNPQTKLLTVLVDSALSEDKKEEPSKTVPVIATAPKPVLEVTKPAPAPKKPKTEKVSKEEKTESEQKIEETIAPTNDDPIEEINNDQWSSILHKVKEVSTPFQSILKHCQPIFDKDTQILNLKFKYQLHRKKADDTKVKQTLTKAIISVLGNAPSVTTEVDSKSEPPKIKPPKVDMDDTAKAVADIMGGGEAIASV